MRIYSGVDFCDMQVLSTDVTPLSADGRAQRPKKGRIVVNSMGNSFEDGWCYRRRDQLLSCIPNGCGIEAALDFLQKGPEQ